VISPESGTKVSRFVWVMTGIFSGWYSRCQDASRARPRAVLLGFDERIDDREELLLRLGAQALDLLLQLRSRAALRGWRLPIMTASNSASDSAAAPFSRSFSRGLSSIGQSLIAMLPSMRVHREGQ
jgi:hypothetical protein